MDNLKNCLVERTNKVQNLSSQGILGTTSSKGFLFDSSSFFSSSRIQFKEVVPLLLALDMLGFEF